MISKYRAIAQHFAEQIDSQKLTPGDALPSEGKMMEQFDASRDTVRKAMALLEQRHYISKSRGRESTVADRTRYNFPISHITTFTELMEQEHLPYKTKVEDLSIVLGDTRIAGKLQVGPEEEVYRLYRSRSIEGERVILDQDYLLRRLVPGLTREICQGSLYRYLEDTLGLEIGVAKKVVTVQRVTREDQLYMDLRGDSVVAVVSSYTRLRDGTLFQYTESRHRIDRFQFVEYASRGRLP